MSEPQSPEKPETATPPSKRPAWIAGSVLILIGVVFIVQNVAGLSMQNWWALFILIPAIGSLVTAYGIVARNNGRFTVASRGPLIGGLVLIFVTVVLFFNLDWGQIWPIFLIIAGVGWLLTSLGRKT